MFSNVVIIQREIWWDQRTAGLPLIGRGQAVCQTTPLILKADLGFSFMSEGGQINVVVEEEERRDG